MPYSNVPEEKWGSMERCVVRVQASRRGLSKGAAIAICYSSIMGKKVLLSPYPVGEKFVGDLAPPEGGDPLSWQQVAERGDEWAQRQLGRREEALKARCLVDGCSAKTTQLLDVKGNLLPYCDEHLGGAKELVSRHGIVVDGVKSAEQIIVDAKGSFITNDEGRVIFIGGPGGGGGTSGGMTAFDKLVSNSINPGEGDYGDLDNHSMSILDDVAKRVPSKLLMSDDYKVFMYTNAEDWKQAYDEIFDDGEWEECSAFITRGGGIDLIHVNPDSYSAESSLVHEFGHRLEHEAMGKPADRFVLAWQAEWVDDSGFDRFTDYAESSAREGFAETFVGFTLGLNPELPEFALIQGALDAL